MKSKKLKSVLGNQILQFLFTKYAVYALQFATSLFIAEYLGVYYLGIWGFINLVILYFSQIDFGVSHAITLMGSKRNKDQDYISTLLTNTIAILSIIIISVITFLTLNYYFNFFGKKYDFNNFILPVTLIISFTLITPVLSGLARVMGEIKVISIVQVIQPITMFICIFFFKGKALLWALLWSYVLSLLLSVIFLSRHLRFIRLKQPSLKFIKEILNKSVYLFIYTTAFYFMLYFTRTIVSDIGTVQQFGYFTFAFTLANIVTLLLKSFSFLIFPKVINRFSSGDTAKFTDLLLNIRSTYIISAHFLMHLLILIFPLFIHFFPKYTESQRLFQLIIISTILYSNAMGYQGLLLAQNREKQIALLSSLALMLNIGVAFLFAYIFKLPYEFIVLSTGLSYLIYVFMLSYFGRRMLGLDTKFYSIMKEAFPYNLQIPYFLSLFLILTKVNDYFFIIPFILFIFFNLKNFKTIFLTVKKIIDNPKFVNI